MEIEDKIEIKDILDRITSKLDYVTSANSDIQDDGLNCLLIDILGEVKKATVLLG